MSIPFWQENPDAPWATLLRTVETFCHPEADEDAYAGLQRLAKRADTERMRVFKEELRSAIRDPSQLPGDSLFWAAQYDDGSPEAFLARLWRDLYPEEAVPSA